MEKGGAKITYGPPYPFIFFSQAAKVSTILFLDITTTYRVS
jgi:hypothetical protein